ncbi:MAG: preprotein translocase subunit YajC [Caldimicrobium thiodismutans]|uniref:Sec translocon accessory complex subunit YajC n=1 Tax=Caldimicrobium thiodismutans TaxID=1653476 RepID=A0A2N7PJ08_9BACT|nr:MAG: preprotein translocase subunit YajC [Caldimicrobium thiodismutans]
MVTEAFAMAPPPQGQGGQGGIVGIILTLLPLILIFVIFYFLLIRPQQKRLKEHQKFLSELRPGQKVFTSGGLIGRVTKIEGDLVWLEVEKDVQIPVIKGYIAGPFQQ